MLRTPRKEQTARCRMRLYAKVGSDHGGTRMTQGG